MPEVLERNSTLFERIDTLLGRMPNKSRQLFAGLGDQLAGYLKGPLEALNRMDFTGLGQRIGAFIAVGLQSIEDGTFTRFIRLAIEAGFEQGLSTASEMLDALGSDTSWAKGLATTAMTIGVGFGKWISDALGLLSLGATYVTSAFVFAFEKGREKWDQLKNILLSGLAEVVNFFSGGLEKILNKAIEWANRIPGVDIGTATLGRVEFDTGEDGFEARSYADILQSQQEKVVDNADARREFLDQSLRESLDIIGAQTEGMEGQVSATEQLNELIRERIRMREEESAPGGPEETSTGGVETGSFGGIGQESFADKSEERFGDYQAGRGDYGVGTWQAAKAAMMDYVTSAGTVAQQVYSSIGSIATGLQQGISESLTGLINKTMSWGDALRNIGSSIVNSVIGSFAKMASQWIVKRTMMFVLGRKLDAAETASNVAKNSAIVASETSTAAATTAAWTPAALVKSIATFGVAAIIGLALLTAALSSFATGGYTGDGGRLEPAGVVHKGEFVMPADVVSRQGPQFFYSLMESLRFDRPAPAANAAYATGGLVGNAPPAAAMRTASEPTAPENRFNIGLFQDPEALNRWAQSQEGETVIMDVLRRNRHEFQG
jgi:hypothetical protein